MPVAALSPLPATLPGFASEAERDRFTPVALKALLRLAEAWQLTGQEAAALLGVSATTWDRMRAGRWAGTLSQDQLTRASALIGLFKALHLLFADAMADRWPRLPNRNPLFGGASPVAAMIEGGIPRLIEARRHVDAMRGGL
ncbi:antitoxin Xre-like helix-turn-helix domain-containing protein [Falsiroseomonas selenitidurans]|uniref:DUF2384 domain-containing protein n=1 Tax=Falsiroseomonas selenitidurans TaxID=2716335 RepID=A0ABX1E4V2_9PROT|nr:antitoxin Xre-like helix-turn-helix domain-containing protein [Falsiroseomonas selenitidurans]NKC32219.1 DUF2384 domain-containing protein [Falsiroseomonas selenitidurans]